MTKKLLYTVSLLTIYNVALAQTQIGADINGEVAYDNSGVSVALSANGNIVAIGTVGSPINSGNSTIAGYVRVFQNIEGIWTQIGNNINGEAISDLFGDSVALSSDGNIVAVGAPKNDGNGTDSGHVRIFQNTAGNWSQIGNDINGEAIGDRSGYNNIALSSDGNIVVVGAPNNDGNGIDSGHVRVYQNIAGNWTQIGNDINGEAASDFSGLCIDLSSDGCILAIGAFRNDGNGIDSGHVRVFDLSAILSSDTFVLKNTKIYPNPVKNELHIDLEQGLTLQEVNIYSSLGQFIKKEKTNTINVSSLSKGFYLVQIVTEKGKATHKILVE